MPGVMHAPEGVEEKEYDLHEEQPQVCGARAGFWHMGRAYMRRQRVRRLQSTLSASHVSRHPIEMPMERLARENLTLYIRVFTGL
jgi:hypothetical protein